MKTPTPHARQDGPGRRRTLIGLAATVLAAGLAAAAPAASAQTSFPSKPIRLIVTLPAGTSADVMARFVGQRLSRALGQPVIVENQPGASSMIGTRTVAGAPADGHTLLYGLAPAFSLNPHLHKNLPYKASDFAPIIHLLDVPFVMVVRADAPYNTLADFLAAGKARPGELNYSSYGEGSPNHVALLPILQANGATMTHVPYKDGGLTDILGGLVDGSLEVTAMALPNIQAGKLRPLAVSARERLPKLPDVPTLGELGQGSPLYSWNGIFAPAGTPPAVLDRLAVALQEIAASDEYREKVLEFAQVPVGGTPEAFAAFLEEDSKAWGKVITDNAIRLD